MAGAVKAAALAAVVASRTRGILCLQLIDAQLCLFVSAALFLWPTSLCSSSVV